MSLTDTLGSLAVASHGQYMTGVSTDISTSFVKPAGKPGDKLRMVATLTAMGAFIAVSLHILAITRCCDSSAPRRVAGVHSGRFYQRSGATGCLRE
jgi:acyl-coenzyme A thioesterase PaaI-like protein